MKAFATEVLSRGRPRWLSLLGPPGVGKTHILSQLVEMLERYRQHWKVRTPDGWRGVQIAHIIPAEDLEDYKAPKAFAKYDLIYIEDIGSGADSAAGSGKVLRNRVLELLQLRTKKWTLADSNLSTEEIADQFDARIASRLRRDGSLAIKLNDKIPDYQDR